MFIPIIIGVAVVALFVLIFSMSGKITVGGDERLGIKKIKGKYNVQLIAHSPLDINLLLGKPSFWTRLLGGTPLFRLPKSDDAEFDKLFAITAYREDVLRVIQTNAEFRRTMIQLTKDVPGLSLLCYAKAKLTLAIAASPYAGQKPIEAARDTFAAILPNLLAPFERFSADTAQEARSFAIDHWAPSAAIMSMLFLSVFGISVDLPPASGEFPAKLVMQGSAIYFAFHIVLLFCLTGQWRARLQGIIMSLGAAFILAFTGMPGIVATINAHSQQAVITETVAVRVLQKIEPRRGPSHYYVLLFHAPAHLVVGTRVPSTSVEISHALYDALESQNVHRDSQVELTEVTGLLGLTYVVDAKSKTNENVGRQ
jgi:hypothetical protein